MNDDHKYMLVLAASIFIVLAGFALFVVAIGVMLG